MVLLITVILSAIAADLVSGSHVNVQAAANARRAPGLFSRAKRKLELFVLRFRGARQKQLGLHPVPVWALRFSRLLRYDEGRPERAPPMLRGRRPEDPGGDDDEGKADRDKTVTRRSAAVRAIRTTALLLRPTSLRRFRRVVLDRRSRRRESEDQSECGGALRDWLSRFLACDDRRGTERSSVRSALRGDWRHARSAAYSRWDHLKLTVGSMAATPLSPFVLSPGSATRRSAKTPATIICRTMRTTKPKNGMFNSLAELRLVPGINDAFMRLFAQYFTVWSDSGVSVKTASQPMLRAIILAVASNPPLPGDEVNAYEVLSELALATAMPGVKMSQSLFETLLTTAEIPYDKKRLSEPRSPRRDHLRRRVERLSHHGRRQFMARLRRSRPSGATTEPEDFLPTSSITGARSSDACRWRSLAVDIGSWSRRVRTEPPPDLVAAEIPLPQAEVQRWPAGGSRRWAVTEIFVPTSSFSYQGMPRSCASLPYADARRIDQTIAGGLGSVAITGSTTRSSRTSSSREGRGGLALAVRGGAERPGQRRSETFQAAGLDPRFLPIDVVSCSTCIRICSDDASRPEAPPGPPRRRRPSLWRRRTPHPDASYRRYRSRTHARLPRRARVILRSSACFGPEATDVTPRSRWLTDLDGRR